MVEDDGIEQVEADHQGMLVVTRGPNVGARIPLAEARLTVGRHPESDLFLDDITVSRRHAEVTYSGGRYQVRDVGLAQRHLREPRAGGRGLVGGGRRGADRQVQAGVHGRLSRGGELSERAAPHLSIGEVLSLLQDEFPDITISKIRFLESQGLLDPERTPSGYRKFYEHDLPGCAGS